MAHWNIDDGQSNELSAGIQLESQARKAAQRAANERGESVYLYEAGDGATETEYEEIAPEAKLPADAVLVESMPDEHRDSHRAAGNWGSYPANGAERRIMSRADGQDVVDADDDGYARILRDATSADIGRYEVI